MLQSILEGTMAEMSYPQVNQAAQDKAIVMLPLGVIEEHGPHLPLCTDIYLSTAKCRLVCDHLDSLGQKAIIAPPYYWGINGGVIMFPGSFSTSKETLTAMLADIIESLYRFGFRTVVGVNGHGDPTHNGCIIEAFRRVREAHSDLDAAYVVWHEMLENYKLNGNEPYVLVDETPMVSAKASCFDVHAGCEETGAMAHFYPHIVNTEMAKTLPPCNLTMEEFEMWETDPLRNPEVAPDGYVGAPAEFALVDQGAVYDRFGEVTAANILKRIKA